MKRRTKRRRVLNQIDRRAWTLDDPCMFCGWTGEHATERKDNGREGHHKATCGSCGKFQKFIGNQEMLDREMRLAIDND